MTKKTKILTNTYKKISVLGKPFQVSVETLKEAHGECNGPEYKISLHNKITKEQADSTLFHEAVHAALYVSGLSSMLDNDNLEEAIVVCIENAFADSIDITKLIIK